MGAIRAISGMLSGFRHCIVMIAAARSSPSIGMIGSGDPLPNRPVQDHVWRRGTHIADHRQSELPLFDVKEIDRKG